jgi:CRP-like cAMP-binding protein
MPTRVETLLTLGRVPLFAALTTRQLADIAERARWVTVAAGEVVVAAGEALDALVVVEDGELTLGERRVVRGEIVDELAAVSPVALAADLRAVGPARLVRLERVAFEELIDDVPGLASAVCRALGARLRAREPRADRAPLTTLR